MNLLEEARKVRDDFLRATILDLLDRENITQAAKIAGVERANFMRLMRRLGIKKPPGTPLNPAASIAITAP